MKKEDSSSTAGIDHLKSFLLLTDTRVVKTAVCAVLISKILEEFNFNKEYYKDVLEFNFKNCKQIFDQNRLDAFYLPSSIQKKINKLYDSIKKSEKEIYLNLNLDQSIKNTYSPLETKYVFEYFKKYNTFDYDKNNKITITELLNPLNCLDKKEYNLMFN
jgi:hypothetical protein